MKVRSDNQSGVTGVTFDKTHKLWVACLNIQRRKVFYKYFKTREEAIAARKQALVEYAGKIAEADRQQRDKQKKYKTENERKAANKDIRKRFRDRQNQDSPLLVFFRNKKYRAKADGIAFAIEYSDLTTPNCCDICGVTILLRPAKRMTGNTATIDRIDPRNGYLKDNWQWACWNCNRCKSDFIESWRFRAIADNLDHHISPIQLN